MTYSDKLTKKKKAKKMGISRPTLDRYLRDGFPKIEKGSIELGRRKIEIENEIRLYEFELSNLKEELKNINKSLEEEEQC